MGSLKQYTTQVIDAIGKPFDHMLYMRVKDLFIHELATVIKAESDKSGLDLNWILYVEIPVIKVDPADYPNIETYKRVYRSVNKLPKAIRLRHMSPLVYVGSIDRALPYLYVTSYASALRLKYVDEVGDVPKYTLRNGYLEVYINDANLKKLLIGHAFVDSYAISNVTSTTPETFQDENSELLIPEDIIRRVKENIIKSELSLIEPKDNVVNISNNEQLSK